MHSNSLLDSLAEENGQNIVDALENANLAWATILVKYIMIIAIFVFPAFVSLYSLRNQIQEGCSSRALNKAMAEQNLIDRLYQTIVRQDIPSIKNMLKNLEVNLDKTSSNFQETCLELAVRIGNTEIVQILLDSGAGIDANNPVRDTLPITMAITNVDLKMIELLVKNGADIHKASQFYEFENHAVSKVYLTQFEYAQSRYGANYPEMLDLMSSLGCGVKSARQAHAKTKA